MRRKVGWGRRRKAADTEEAFGNVARGCRLHPDWAGGAGLEDAPKPYHVGGCGPTVSPPGSVRNSRLHPLGHQNLHLHEVRGWFACIKDKEAAWWERVVQGAGCLVGRGNGSLEGEGAAQNLPAVSRGSSTSQTVLERAGVIAAIFSHWTSSATF